MTEQTLYVTEGQIIERMGVGLHAGRKAVQQMRLHPKFPPKNIGGKRYWPSVRAFLDIWNGLSVSAPGDQAGQEIEKNEQTPYRGRARASLEAAKERLGRRVAAAAERRRSGLQAAEPADRRVHEHAD